MTDRRRSALVTAAFIAVLAAGIACKRSSGSTASGAGTPAGVNNPPPAPPPDPNTEPPPVVEQDFTGRWRLFFTAISGNGTCYPIDDEVEIGVIDVDGSGAFRLDNHTVNGQIDSDGDVAFSLSDPEPCGSGIAAGRCTSSQSCSGTFNQSDSGNWRLERLE